MGDIKFGKKKPKAPLQGCVASLGRLIPNLASIRCVIKTDISRRVPQNVIQHM